jgi:hypothetical protein
VSVNVEAISVGLIVPFFFIAIAGAAVYYRYDVLVALYSANEQNELPNRLQTPPNKILTHHGSEDVESGAVSLRRPARNPRTFENGFMDNDMSISTTAKRNNCNGDASSPLTNRGQHSPAGLDTFLIQDMPGSAKIPGKDLSSKASRESAWNRNADDGAGKSDYLPPAVSATVNAAATAPAVADLTWVARLPPMGPTFQRSVFMEVNQRYLNGSLGSRLSRRDLGAGTASISSDFPNLGTQISQITKLFSNREFNAYFQNNADFAEVRLRAITLISFIRLVDNRVRSSIVFAEDTKSVGWLIGKEPASYDDAVRLSIHNIVNTNWKEMFQDLWLEPHNVLTKVKEPQVLHQQLVSILDCYKVNDIDPDALLARISAFLSFCKESVPKLVEIIVTVALGPHQASFEDEELVCAANMEKHRRVRDSTNGSHYAAVVIFPRIVTVNNGVANKSFIYYFHR